MDYDAIVVGCGHNGLVAAHYLAAAGLRVLGLERNAQVGGAATTDELIPGYHFSTCAHSFVLFHTKVLDDLRLLDYGLEVTRRDPGGFQPFRSGRHLLFWDDEERTRDSIAQISPHDARAHQAYSEVWDRAADLFEPYLLTDPPTLPEFLQRYEGTPDEELAYRLVTGTRRQMLEEFFESEEIKSALGTTFDGGSTDSPGSLLYFAFHLSLSRKLSDRGLMGFPRGGMGAVTQAIRRSAEAAGAEIRTSTPVASIIVSNDRTAGVRLDDGAEITAPIVVSNADPRRTLLELVGEQSLTPEFSTDVRRLHANAGYMKLHCATNGLPDWTALPGADLQPHHGAGARLCTSLDTIDEAWAHARRGEFPAEHVLGIVTPSVFYPTLAPPGHHTLSIWVEYAPIRPREGSWDDVREWVSQALINQVAEYAPNFPDIVDDMYLHTPTDIEAKAGMTNGSMHHIDMTIDQMLARRPLPGWSKYRTPIDGLYLCGSGSHPGGGVSGVPGHNAAQAVLKDRA